MVQSRDGYHSLCAMPGPGPWQLTTFNGTIVAASAERGTFTLEIEATSSGLTGRWSPVDIVAALSSGFCDRYAAVMSEAMQ